MSLKSTIKDAVTLFKHRKALSQASKLVKTVSTIKRGWRTPAFWGTVLVDVGALVGALTGVIPPVVAATTMTIVNGGYFVVRSIKKSQDTADTNLWRSTEVYLGIFDIVSKGLIDMQTAGMSAQWLVTLNGIMGGIMTYFTKMADNDPEDPIIVEAMSKLPPEEK